MKSLFSMAASSVFSMLLLVGCGNGGGGGEAVAPAAAVAPTLSGTASAGAPIIGTVTIKDSATPFNTKTVTIAADGKYTVPVTGLTAPFMLRADGTAGGTTYSLYSAAASADVNGTINVTPLTDLIVANIAGQIASNFFTAGNFSTLTTAALTAQEIALRARLQPILTAAGVAGSIDLLRASFAADHTGLDKALDALRVTINPATATATITSIIDNQQITDNLASQADATILTPTNATNISTGLSELQQIVARFDAFSALFATALPASNNATLLALFDSTFLIDGQDTAAFLSEITSDPTVIGVKLTNVSLVPGSLTPANAPTTAKVAFSVITKGANPDSEEFTLNKVGTTWKFAGNRRIAQARAHSFARLQDVFINNVLQTNYIDTGLKFSIKAPTAAGLASINSTVPTGASYYAVVTGSGLPAAGALYVSDLSQTGSGFYAAAGAPSTYAGNTTPQLSNFGQNQFPLSDTAIAALLDNEIYTIKIYHNNATATANATSDDVLLATYTSNAGKRPYLKTELAVASFAVITAPTKAALTAFANAGGTITVTWTLPTTTLGAKSGDVHYFRKGSTGSTPTGVDVAATATSAGLTITSLAAANIGTLVSNGIVLSINDSFNRELKTIYNGS